jgi:polyferredoxin
MNFFEKLNDGIRNIEASFVNFISAVAPWLAPLVPAYMTYWHAVDTLDFPEWVAFPAALVVEILGFSAVSTFMTFWFFNRRNKANAKKAPLPLVVFAFFFYLALIVTSNILLDASGGAEWAVIAVRALFTLQTIPAALIVVARAGHRSLLSDMAKEKAEQDANRANEEANRSPEDEPKTNRSRTFANLSQSEKYYIVNTKSTEAAKEFGVTERAIQKWRKQVQEEMAQGKL